MSALVEALQHLARQRTRGDSSPLIALRSVPARTGVPTTNLRIGKRLAEAWLSLTGQTHYQHQAVALAAVRRAEPVALVGGGAVARQTLHLLLTDRLESEPATTALLLVPDADSAACHLTELGRLAPQLTIARADGAELRAAFNARLVIATPQALHERLLRHHDRAWRAFWTQLRIIGVAEAHCYPGVAAAHLAGLLLRARRLSSQTTPLQLVATLAAVAGISEALTPLADGWRLVDADDAPRPAVSIAFWRADSDRARDAVALALGLARAGAPARLVCSPLEVAPLRALVGSDADDVVVSSMVLPAAVQILCAAAPAPAALAEAIASGARLVVVLLGNDPAERMLTRRIQADLADIPLLDDAPPAWVTPALNAYVAAEHVLCAATERPLTAAEIESWALGSILKRLVDAGRLVQLPEAAPAWQPVPTAHDPYVGFDRHAAGAPAIHVLTDQGAPLAAFDPAAFDRWGYPGAQVPPLRGWLQVIERDEEAGLMIVRAGSATRRSLPLRRCTVRVRDEIERTAAFERTLAWGRVMIEETIYGYREVNGANAPAERALSTPLVNGWTAAATWFELPPITAPSGQIVGWSLVSALSLRTLSPASDCVPMYDADTRRLYFVDAQPGGNGIAVWLYAHLSDLLPLAYDIALDCRNDPLFEPIARVDMDWLLALLGGRGGLADRRTGEQGDRGTEEPGNRGTGRVEPQAPPRREGVPPIREPRREVEPPVRREPEPPARREVEPPVRREPEPPIREPRREAEPPIREPRREVEPPVRREPEPPVRQEPPVPVRREPPVRREGEPPVRREAEPRQSELPLGEPVRSDVPECEAESPPRRGPGFTPASAPPESRRGLQPAPPESRRGLQPAPPDPLPDAAAMVERLRRMREQREQRAGSAPPRRIRSAPDAAPEPRFKPGDRIHATPYGEGEVVRSRVTDDQEILVVAFPDHGELTIDAAVSAVRLMERRTDDDAEADEPPF